MNSGNFGLGNSSDNVTTRTENRKQRRRREEREEKSKTRERNRQPFPLHMKQPQVFSKDTSPHESPSALLDADLQSYEGMLKNSISQCPKDPILIGQQACLLSMYEDRRPEAIACFKSCFELCGPEHKAAEDMYRCLYATFLSSKDVPLASKMYEAVLNSDSKHPLALGDSAVHYHRVVRDYTKADLRYKQSRECHPTHGSVRAKHANYLKSVRRDVGAAGSEFEEAIKGGTADALSAYAVFLHGTVGDADKAEAMYRRAFDADPTHVNNLSNFGLFLSEIRCDYSGAEEMYNAAMLADSSHANAVYNYSVLLDSGIGDQKRAEDMYRKCLTIDDSHRFACYNLAVLVEEVRGDTKDGREEARALFERAVEVNPNDAVTVADAGRFLLVCAKDVDGAEKTLRRAIKLDGGCVVANYNLGVLRMNHHGDKPGAAECFLEVLKGESEHVEALRCMARLDGKQADAYWKRCLVAAGNQGAPVQEIRSEYESWKKRSARGNRRGSK